MSTENTYSWLASYPPDVDWEAPLVRGPVHALLDNTVAAYGDRPGVDFMGKKWTWGEVGAAVDALAAGLQAWGLQKGARVGLFLPNSFEYLVSYYAVLKAGGIVVNFNPLYAPRELEFQVRDSGISTMITFDLAALFDKVKPLLGQAQLETVIVCRFADSLPFPKSLLFPLLKKKDIAAVPAAPGIVRLTDICRPGIKPAPVAIDPDSDIAVLQYTGGTTGTPKGAMLTHANVSANVHQSVLWFGNVSKGEERMLAVIPFFHVFAMTAVMNFSVAAALELVIPSPRFDVDGTLKAIAKKKPHYFPAVPAIYNAINNHADRDSYDLRSLRYCISGGAPLPVEVKKTFEKNTGCVVIEGYGLTESTPVVCANPIKGENKAGSIGLPLPGTVVEIIDPEDKNTPMKTGERGELCVRGPQVMKGYWNKPEETAHVLRGGRLHTADIAYMDAAGYVYIVDRIKDLILVNGYNVYPRLVEEAIYLHPAVEECIVAGLPDPERGEMVKAWIKLKGGQNLDEASLKSFLKDKISPIEMPRAVEFRDKPLPKTMIGKLSRKDIVNEEMARRT